MATFFEGYSEKSVAVSSTAGSLAINYSTASANLFYTTLTEDITNWTITNIQAGESVTVTLEVTQAPGNYQVTNYPGAVTWITGTPPVIPSSSGVITLIILTTRDQGVTWIGSYVTDPGDSGGVGEAPEDGTSYAREDADWISTINDITAESIGDLSDVDLTGLATTKILEYDGANFVLIDTPSGGGGSQETFQPVSALGSLLFLDLSANTNFKVAGAAVDYDVTPTNVPAGSTDISKISYIQELTYGNLGNPMYPNPTSVVVSGTQMYVGDILRSKLETWDQGATYTASNFYDASGNGLRGVPVEEGRDTSTLNWYATAAFVNDSGTVRVCTGQSSPNKIVYWNGSSYANTTTTGLSNALQGICGAADGSIVYVSATGALTYKSTNSGQTWTLLSALPPTGVTHGMKCSEDGQTIIVTSTTGDYSMSYDGGASWTAIKEMGYTNKVEGADISMSADGQTIVYKDKGTATASNSVYVSTDAGVSFVARVTGATIRGVNMFADKTLVGYQALDSYTSDDLGVTWVKHTGAMAENHTSGMLLIPMHSTKVVYYISSSGVCEVSTDGGRTWGSEVFDLDSTTFAVKLEYGSVAISASGDFMFAAKNTFSTSNILRCITYTS